MRNLKGKRALITGSAQGIGKAIATALAQRGCEIVLTDLQPEPLAATATELRRLGVPIASYLLDVTDPAAVLAVRDQIHRDLGTVDIVVNNAGTVFGGSFLDVPLERHLLTYRVNTLGLVAVTHAFLPDLIGRPEANLTNITSASAFVGLPFGTTYASSKWAALGFSEGLRLELAELGHGHVTVTAVCPSYVKTGLFDGVKLPTSTDWLTPERLAALVVRGIERNKALVLAPAIVRSTPFFRGVLPLWAFDWIGRLFGINTTMHTWRGHSTSTPATSAAATASAQVASSAPGRDEAGVP